MIDLQEKARAIVFEYVRSQLQGTGEEGTLESMDQVRVSWWSKTLGNWKALVVTDLPDDMYYEVTHSGERKVTFLDAYVKIDNLEIPDAAEELFEKIAELPPRILATGRIQEMHITAGPSLFPGGGIKTVPLKFGEGEVGDDRPVIGEADVNLETGRVEMRINIDGDVPRSAEKIADLIQEKLPPMSFGFQ